MGLLGEEEAGKDLVRRLRDGDPDALAETYRRWGSLVHSVAMRSVGDRADADDVTQQVFVSAWTSRSTLRPTSGSLAGWLVAITRRRCADLHEARSRERRRHLVAAGQHSVAHPPPDDVIERVVIAHELARLGDPRAKIVRMAVIEGRSHTDIAQRLDLPLGTVKSHVRRGLLALRARLEEVNP